jgi:predicted peptidase
MAATLPRDFPADNRQRTLQDRLLRWLLLAALLLLALQIIWPSVERWLNRPRPGRQVLQNWSPPPRGLSRSYWTYLPQSYQSDGRQWPLILSLHGSGDSGDDPSKVANGGLPSHLGVDLSLDAVVVSPQCAARRMWEPLALTEVLDRLQREFCIDPDRVYIVGYSMGGFGAWELAGASPHRVAAIICLGGVGGRGDRWPGIPVWAVHGDSDKVVPIASVQKSITAAGNASSNVHFTILRGRGHDVENEVMENPKLLEWLLKQERQ